MSRRGAVMVTLPCMRSRTASHASEEKGWCDVPRGRVNRLGPSLNSSDLFTTCHINYLYVHTYLLCII